MADAWQSLLRCGALTLALCDTLDALHRSADERGDMGQPVVLRLYALCEELRVSSAWALCLDTNDVRRQLRERADAERLAA
jgi:hypothetical protein